MAALASLEFFIENPDIWNVVVDGLASVRELFWK